MKGLWITRLNRLPGGSGWCLHWSLCARRCRRPAGRTVQAQGHVGMVGPIRVASKPDVPLIERKTLRMRGGFAVVGRQEIRATDRLHNPCPRKSQGNVIDQFVGYQRRAGIAGGHLGGWTGAGDASARRADRQGRRHSARRRPPSQGPRVISQGPRTISRGPRTIRRAPLTVAAPAAPRECSGGLGWPCAGRPHRTRRAGPSGPWAAASGGLGRRAERCHGRRRARLRPWGPMCAGGASDAIQADACLLGPFLAPIGRGSRPAESAHLCVVGNYVISPICACDDRIANSTMRTWPNVSGALVLRQA